MERLESTLFHSVRDATNRDIVARRVRGLFKWALPYNFSEFLWHAVLPPQSGEPITVRVNGSSARFWRVTPGERDRLHPVNYEGAYAEAIITALADRDNPIFLDVGAAEGLYSILGAKAGATVYAFDPDPVTRASFEKNLELNPEVKDRITYHPWALGEDDREDLLYVDVRYLRASSMRQIFPRVSNPLSVSVYKVDSLRGDGIIESPDVIKIDVEGGEGAVLTGMRESMTQARSVDLFVEIHPSYLAYFGTTAAEVVSLVKDMGFDERNVWRQGPRFLCYYRKD